MSKKTKAEKHARRVHRMRRRSRRHPNPAAHFDPSYSGLTRTESGVAHLITGILMLAGDDFLNGLDGGVPDDWVEPPGIRR